MFEIKNNRINESKIKLAAAFANLEEVIQEKINKDELKAIKKELELLKFENKEMKDKYLSVKEKTKEVASEIDNSIGLLEKLLEKENANN
jgi:hypothetical protein